MRFGRAPGHRPREPKSLPATTLPDALTTLVGTTVGYVSCTVPEQISDPAAKVARRRRSSSASDIDEFNAFDPALRKLRFRPGTDHVLESLRQPSRLPARRREDDVDATSTEVRGMRFQEASPIGDRRTKQLEATECVLTERFSAARVPREHRAELTAPPERSPSTRTSATSCSSWPRSALLCATGGGRSRKLMRPAVAEWLSLAYPM